MIIGIIIVAIITFLVMYGYTEKKELKEQNSNKSPILKTQKLEALRKERVDIEKRNSNNSNRKDYTSNLIKTDGFYVTKTEKPDGYMFLYFRADGYVLMDRKEHLLNTEAINDTKKYMRKIHSILDKLNDANLSFDFGKYYVEGKKIHIEFLFIDDPYNPYGDSQLESSITMNGHIMAGQLTLSAYSKAYKRLFKTFEERTMFELSSFTYKE